MSPVHRSNKASGKDRDTFKWLPELPTLFRAVNHFAEKVERHLCKFANRRTLAVITVGFASLGIRAALLPILPVPKPLFHDEFSNLLAADTFASGRLTNPTHPMWVHFETEHVLQRPTYMSMYPPAQGLVLAAGQKLANCPWLGVWLSVGIMCAAVTWMLQGWMPATWALLGGTLLLFRLGVLQYWMNSYWGGAVAAIGGALVLGALPRLKQHQRVRNALLMAAGAAMLANSRPYEGLIFCIPTAIAMVIWLTGKQRLAYKTSLLNIVLPIFLVLAVTGAAMCYYFWRVTGNPFEMPYQVCRRTYAVAPVYIWQHLRPEPVYHHARLRDFYIGWEARTFLETQSFSGFLNELWDKAVLFGWFFFGVVFPVAVFGFPATVRDKRVRLIWISFLAMAVGLGLEAWHEPHYMAPMTCVAFALIVQSLRHIRVWKRRRRIGVYVLRTAVAAFCIAFVVTVAYNVQRVPRDPAHYPWNWRRAQVNDELRHLSGDHLVIVRYTPDYEIAFEWVFNRADIDHAKVVWARDMGTQNDELIRYFSNRHVWLLQPTPEPAQLTPYAEGVSAKP